MRGLRRLIPLAAIAVALRAAVVPEEVPAGEAGSRLPQIQFEDITLNPPSFSPNGNNIKDRVEIRYRLQDSTLVDINMETLAGADIDSLRHSARQGPGSQTVLWDGQHRNGNVQPDGVYVIRFRGTTIPGGIPLATERQVRIDTQAPRAQPFEIVPRVDTTLVRGAAHVRFRTQVVGSSIGDTLTVAIKTARGVEAIEQHEILNGDGLYESLCDSCFDVAKFPEGKHRVRLRLADPAGNITTVIDSLDRDLNGPETHFVYPYPDTVSIFAVQHADSLTGTMTDRHGVSSALLEIRSSSDTTQIVLPGTTPDSRPLRWSAQLGVLGDREGRYAMEVQARDTYGVLKKRPLTFEIDRTPPPTPRLTPRPGPVSLTQQATLTLAVDTVATALIRRAGDAQAPSDIKVRSALQPLLVVYRPGVNHLTFIGVDLAGNLSPPETLTVSWQTSSGIVAPERFRPNNVIQIGTGDVPANGVEVRVFASDGSLVQRFEDPASKLVYTFTWDLKTQSGNRVKNGAYLLRALVRVGGQEEQRSKLIAVLE